MDSNGLRFWMLSSAEDWGQPRGAYCASTRRLHLPRTSSGTPGVAEDFERAKALIDAVPFALDQFGTYAYYASGHVMAAGPGFVETPIYTPPAAKPVTDLVLGYDGVLYIAVDGQLVLVDRRRRWPNFTLPGSGPDFKVWRLAAHPQGGVVALDREGHQLLRVQGLPLPEVPPLPYAPDVMRPVDENPDPPRVSEVLALPASEYFVAIAGDGAGRFAVLSWHTDAENNAGTPVGVHLRTFSSMTSFDADLTLFGVRHPYALAWLEHERIAVFVSEYKVAFVYSLDTPETALWPTQENYILPDANPGPFAHGFTQPPQYNVGAELMPLVPLSRNWLEQGSTFWAARRFDSGRSRTVWHRLFLEASFPPRCGAVVWLTAADDPAEFFGPCRTWFPHVFGDVETPIKFPQAPRAVWQRVASEVPFHPGLLGQPPEENRKGLFMVLVQRCRVAVRALRGRYLGVKVDLVGDGRSTPEIAALRVYASRFSYVEQYLPELYREHTSGPDEDTPGPSTRPDFFERFVNIFEAPMTQLEDRVASSYLLTHPSSAPDEGLDWLGSWIGVTLDPLPPDRRRAQLQATPTLYRERGTVQGITDALDVATNGLCRRGAVIVVEDYRLRHTFATILGADLAVKDDPLLPGGWESSNSFVGNTLFLGEEHHKEFLSLFSDAIKTAQERAEVGAFFDRLAHRMTVFVHDQVETVDLQLVRRIVEREKPAHVAVAYIRASQPFLVGMASLLGVNTYLAPAPAREIARLDQSAIGRHAVLSHLPALHPSVEDSASAEFGHPVARIRGPREVPRDAPFVLSGGVSSAPRDRAISNYRWTIVKKPT